MTPEERKLWYDFLKKLPITVKRQETIKNYIVDFYCAQQKIVIELDGSQHYEIDGIASDEERDKTLQNLGISVLRFSNQDIRKNFAGVCETILSRFGLTWNDIKHN